MEDKKVEILDISGNILLPGHMFVYNRANRYTHGLGIGIMLDNLESYESQNYYTKIKETYYTANYIPIRTDLKCVIQQLACGLQGEYIETLSKVDTNFVLYGVNNDRIAGILTTVDKAKMKNLLPDDYVIGKAFKDEYTIVKK